MSVAYYLLRPSQNKCDKQVFLEYSDKINTYDKKITRLHPFLSMLYHLGAYNYIASLSHWVQKRI
jgi:hypothetical protein